MILPSGQKEAFSRVVIDAQLKDVGRDLTDGHSVRYEYQLPDGTLADYVICDRHGRAAAVIEAKRASENLHEAAAQGRAYAEQLHDVPYVFLANGDEILFWDYRAEAYPRKVASFYSQVDLERRYAKRQVRVDPLTRPVDTRIAGRDYQRDCIDALCREMNTGRRKLLVEMATGTGKTRTAAAFIKRLFEVWIAGRTDLHSERRRLLLTIGEYIKANAGDLDEFTVDHFVVPPFSNIGGLQRAVQTFGSEDALTRIIAGMNTMVFAEDIVHEGHAGTPRFPLFPTS